MVFRAGQEGNWADHLDCSVGRGEEMSKGRVALALRAEDVSDLSAFGNGNRPARGPTVNSNMQERCRP